MRVYGLLDRPANYDHDYDGRPPTGAYGDDPLLAALIRWHPEHMPAELIPKLDRRVSILASAE